MIQVQTRLASHSHIHRQIKTIATWTFPQTTKRDKVFVALAQHDSIAGRLMKRETVSCPSTRWTVSVHGEKLHAALPVMTTWIHYRRETRWTSVQNIFFSCPIIPGLRCRSFDKCGLRLIVTSTVASRLEVLPCRDSRDQALTVAKQNMNWPQLDVHPSKLSVNIFHADGTGATATCLHRPPRSLF